MKGIHIRRADVSDAQIISYLGKKTFTETFADLFSDDELNAYLDKTFDIEKLERSISKNQNVFGILYDQDIPAGYYKIKFGLDFDNSADPDCVQLQKIYVLRDHLHLKLGKGMLNHIFNLREMEYRKIIWLVVLQTNQKAIGFYRRFGFYKYKTSDYSIGSHHLEYDLMIKKSQTP